MGDRTQPLDTDLAPGPQFTAESPAGAPAVRGRQLTVQTGPHAGQVFMLTRESTVIGRDEDADVPLPDDPTVSRRHARVEVEQAGHVLYDEGSSNGTFVNGVLLGTCVLAPGDVIQCGSIQLRYE